MIKAISDSQQPTTQTPTVITPPSFPTHNPARQNKNMMRNAPLSPSVKPINIAPGGKTTPPTTSSPATGATPNSPTIQPVIPAKPKFPDPTTKTYIKSDGTKTSNDESDNNTRSKPKKKSNWKMAVGVIVLLLVVLGTGTGFYLTQQSQDLRQQASECVQECPGADGVLRDCTPPESDGTARESVCTSPFTGNISSCNNIDFCCNGASWTRDLNICNTVTPVACNETCTTDEECSTAVAGNFCDPASNKCRLKINPTSEACEEAVTPPISSYHDYADSQCRTYGWIIDSNISPNSSLVHVYADGIYGTGTFVGEYLADAVRTDLNDNNITGDHGFDITFNSQNTESSILFDGNPHELYVYGIDSQDPVNSNVLIENTPQTITCPNLTDAVSCENITGTLTDGTVADKTTELTYKVTSSGGDLIEIVQISIHGNFEGPGVSEGWVTLIRENNPTDNILTNSTTYEKMIDLLVATGHNRQELIEKGIKYGVNVYGPEGRCTGNNVWSESGSSCTYNGACDGTISLASLETANNNSDNEDDDSSNDDSATPTIGCNDICVTNSDCQDTNHICVTTADGSNRCRLTAYTSSENCVIESSGTGTGTTTTNTTTQPSLPTELPETGPEDWLNWLKAGLVTMGIGTALFLLL